MKKDDLVTLTIEDIGHDGEGIGKVMGMTLFVKDALPGDVVRAKVMKMKKTYGYARLMEILAPSSDRIEPRCPHHKRCGGCQLQALSYESQLKFKEEKVRNNLIRIGGFADPPVHPTLGMKEPYRYRNKAQHPIGVDREGNTVAGFYAARTHSIIPVEDCVLGQQGNSRILDIILSIMEEKQIPAYNEATGKGCVRHVLIRYGEHTGEWMVCLVINEKKLPCKEEFIQRLTEIPGMTSISVNVNREKTNVILGSHTETLWGQSYITDYIGDISFRISPQSFYQVNPGQTRVLYEKALEYAGLTGEETVWDLYCGIGTISLFLAQQAKQVYGVEIVPQAIADAKDNATRNDIHNAEFFVGKAEEVYPAYCKAHGEAAKAQVIVVDPPRKGCEESLLDMMCRMAPERIVYVSCDSATLARDLKYLAAHGYELMEVQPVDQFGQTVHVETVCLLSKLKSANHIEVELNLDELDLTDAEKKATYEEIKAYVLENTGLNITNLYIAQVKQKYGIIERENYNKPKSEDSRQPQCPPEKEAAITDALKHFGMISD